jgi:PAS domain S-box-containing protein
VADFLSHIIQHRRTEKAIRESEEKWRLLTVNAPDIIINVDRASKILFINRTLPGFTVEGTIGKSVYDFTAPENHEMIKRTIEKVFSTGEVADYETGGAGAEGRTVWYSTRVGPIKSNGEVVSAILVSTDITERKQAEEEHKKHVAELEILAKATTGRELKMMELEKEVNALLKELGREPQYKGV